MSEFVSLDNAQVVPRSDYTAVINEIIAAGNCPFCNEHLPKHHKNPILFENDSWILTKNGWPYAGTEFHLLVLAKRHVTEMTDLSETEQHHFFNCISWFKETYTTTGWTVLWRNGDTALTGASVNHLHAHIIVGQKKGEESESITALVGFRPK